MNKNEQDMLIKWIINSQIFFLILERLMTLLPNMPYFLWTSQLVTKMGEVVSIWPFSHT